MKTIKRLQKQLNEGKITAQEYAEQLQELLDDEAIDQATYDEAKDFEVENDDDKLIYSQEDFNRQLLPKARSMVKKALRDAGVNIDNVDNKELLNTFANLALQGQKKGSLDIDEAKANELQKKAAKLDELQPKVKALTLENALLKAAGTYNPLNPKQVVRALEDYSEHLEYDEDDNLVEKSVDRALKKLAEAEPNLFKPSEGSDEEDKKQQQNDFRSKPPGGGGKGTNAEQKVAAKRDEALALMGYKKQSQGGQQ